MKIEVSNFKLSKGKKCIELTFEEANELYTELQKYFQWTTPFTTTSGTTILTNTTNKIGPHDGGGC